MSDKPIKYVPPSDQALEELAQKACEKLASNGRNEFSSKALAWSIASLLKLVAELTAKRLNSESGNTVDTKDQ